MDGYEDFFTESDDKVAALLSASNSASIFGIQSDSEHLKTALSIPHGTQDNDASSEERETDSRMDIDEEPPSLQHDAEERIELGQEEHRGSDCRFRSYDLRLTSVREGKSVWITWLDTDDSGNFDPNDPEGDKRRIRLRREAASTPRRRRSRSASVQHSRHYENDTEPTAAYLSRFAARQRGVSITVTLDLTTLALQKLAASIPDNWPGEAHNIISDEHIRYLADQMNARHAGVKPYNLRKRESNADLSEATEVANSDSGLWLPSNRLIDPLGEETDLRNHPVARGCKACRELQSDCSLLTDEFNWPCFTCAHDECDCELITPPVKRAECEYCKKRRLRCSYRQADSDSSLPCTACASHGFICVAGPDVDHIRVRIGYDKDYSKQHEGELMQDDRKFVACTECRRSKQQCSLRSKSDYPPCGFCRENGTDCSFESLSRKTSKQDRTQSQPATQVEGGTQMITTALNHPIHFLHEAEDECTWCTKSIGVCGRGWHHVEVIPAADGLSYTEVSGGENEDGENDDKMCINCTLDRVQIISCLEHRLQPIADIDLAALEEMISGMLDRIAEGTKQRPEDRWCAVCPAPALYQCCTSQTCDKFAEPIVDPHSEAAKGCGLLLCETCAVSFAELGDLDSVVDAVRDEGGEIWVLGMRADAEFLKKDGLLVKNVLPSDPDVIVID